MTASRGETPETDGYFAVIAPAEWLKHPQREVDGAKEFARRLDIKVGPRSDTVWFPPERLDKPSDWEYVDD